MKQKTYYLMQKIENLRCKYFVRKTICSVSPQGTKRNVDTLFEEFRAHHMLMAFT